MRDPSHALADDWRDARIDPKVRELVAALNNDRLGVKTIAACEGHLRGIHPPYVYFRCPTPLAALLEKRLLLLAVEREGSRFGWHLKGTFNIEFDLCWKLHSYELDLIATHANIFARLSRYWLFRREIDADLEMLAKVVDGLFNEIEATGKAEIPDPYDGKNHAEELRFSALLFKQANRVLVAATQARRRFRHRRNFASTFNARLKHSLPLVKRKIRYWLRNVFSAVVMITTFAAANRTHSEEFNAASSRDLGNPCLESRGEWLDSHRRQ